MLTEDVESDGRDACLLPLVVHLSFVSSHTQAYAGMDVMWRERKEEERQSEPSKESGRREERERE